ncbi:hypothetical protein BgiMline_004501 [Biomphalaria glabrata]|nr:hypothetical protein BgiBS90_002041 [Biomphalaria glabrata]
MLINEVTASMQRNDSEPECSPSPHRGCLSLLTFIYLAVQESISLGELKCIFTYPSMRTERHPSMRTERHPSMRTERHPSLRTEMYRLEQKYA